MNKLEKIKNLLQIEMEDEKILKFIEISDVVFVYEYLGIDGYDELLSVYSTAYQISVFRCKNKITSLKELMIQRMKELTPKTCSQLLKHLF